VQAHEGNGRRWGGGATGESEKTRGANGIETTRIVLGGGWNGESEASCNGILNARYCPKNQYLWGNLEGEIRIYHTDLSNVGAVL
jgi:hypothetical protein